MKPSKNAGRNMSHFYKNAIVARLIKKLRLTPKNT